jgi:hypothetical protein
MKPDIVRKVFMRRPALVFPKAAKLDALRGKGNPFEVLTVVLWASTGDRLTFYTAFVFAPE